MFIRRNIVVVSLVQLVCTSLVIGYFVVGVSAETHTPTHQPDLWNQLEAAFHNDDRAQLVALIASTPPEDKLLAETLLAEFDNPSPSQGRILQRGLQQVGINGNPCNQATIVTAIGNASDGDTIYVPSNITYFEQLGDINKNLTFIASNATCTAPDAVAKATIDANDADGGIWGGMFTVGLGNSVSFTNFNIRDATANFGGIAYVFQNATLTLNNVSISEGVSTNTGGGLRVYTGATLHMRDSAVFGNDAAGGGGGGIAMYQATAVLTDTQIGVVQNANFATGDGGGIKLEQSTLTMTDGSIHGNRTDGNGGGLYASGGSTVTLNSVNVGTSLGFFGRNSANNGGGAYVSFSQLSLNDNSSFDGNNATLFGGGIYGVFTSTVFIDTDAIVSNGFAENGGGVAIDGPGSRLNMPYGGTIRNNQAFVDGGGIHVSNGAYAYLDGATVELNDAAVVVPRQGVNPHGGGVYVGDGSADNPTDLFLLNDTNVFTNTANLGGGVYASGSNIRIIIDDSTLMDNRADATGGAVRVFGAATITVTDSLLAWNRAADGGAIALNNSNGTLTNVDLYANTAESATPTSGRGGGLYTSNNVNVTINDPYFHQNVAKQGGAVYHGSGTLMLHAVNEAGLINANSASSGDGGGIAVVGNANASFFATDGFPFDFSNNIATDGGGLFVEGSASQVGMTGDVNIINNQATQHGGGVYIDDGVLLILDGSTQVRPWIGAANRATGGNGGGIYAVNNAGVGLYNVLLGNPNDAGNTASQHGGGLFADNSQVLFSNVLVSGNSAESNGGGIALTNGSQATIITSYEDASRGLDTTCDPQLLPANSYCSELRNNRADHNGGALFVDNSAATVLATAIVDNRANEAASTFNGSAIYATNNASLSVNNGLVAENSGGNLVDLSANTNFESEHSTYTTNGGDDAIFITMFTAVTLTNSIVWDNGGGIERTAFTSLAATCNIYQSSNVPIGGLGNVIADPAFVTTARGNYRITASSPAADACATGLPFDLDYFMRPVNGDYDRGAFEVSLVPVAITLASGELSTNSTHLITLLGTLLMLPTLHLYGQKRRAAKNR